MEVTIRPLQEEDAYTSVKWRNDPEVFKYTGNIYTHEIKLETEFEWIRRVINNKNDYRCAIEVDGIYVGNIYLNEINTGIGDYNIFIGNKDYWGKGVAKSASRLIIRDGFVKYKLKKIVLKVRIANVRAYQLYLALGFKEVNRDETWIDMELDYNCFSANLDKY